MGDITQPAHLIRYVVTGTWQHPATINSDGDVEVKWDEFEILDVDETSVWCDTCARDVDSDGSDHGLGAEWESL